jgi:hypothetical protein
VAGKVHELRVGSVAGRGKTCGGQKKNAKHQRPAHLDSLYVFSRHLEGTLSF